MIGKTLAHYEIRALLGEGGMGQVYRALDTKLDREVALKLLPPKTAEDVERLARLRREARTLASIHHPRVASLFGLEEVGGETFLVMELIEGPTLAELLEGGSVRRDDAIGIARQIAEGLEEAHGKGIIHRDLKPANIKVAPGDQVKILDFGLARAYANEPSPEDLAHSPTITQAMTQAGVILGTAAYMSPEQAKGKAVDLRSDIWSYGVILFELLCGRQLFEGETVSETMAEVMKGDIEWDRLPSDTPRWLMRLLERCLDRDPNTRLQSIGEARVALERGGDGEDDAETPAAASGPTPGQRPWIPLAAAVLVLAAAVVWFGLREPAPPVQSLRFQMTNPHAANLRQGGGRHIAISADGTQVATIGTGRSDMMLFTRKVDSFDWKPVIGTEGAQVPVFSRDGKWLAFLGNRSLQKVNLNGGAPIRLLDATGFIQSICWADDGYIYGAHSGEFWRVAEGGGERESVHVVEDESMGMIGSPFVLPGARGILFHTGGEGTSLNELHVLDLETGTITGLDLMGTDPRYLDAGALVFAQNGQILAVRFDVDRLEVRGAPVPVFDRVWVEQSIMHLDVSEQGTVAYLPDLGNTKPELHVVDREGNGRDLLSGELPLGSFSDPRLSPDGTRLVISADRFQVWMIDLPTETPTLLSENGFYPLWSPDGNTVTYGSTRNRSYDLYRIPADLSQPEELILDWDTNLRTVEMASDGTLVFRDEIPGKGMDLKLWPDDDPESIAPLMEGPDDELAATLSPDERWMAFVSDLSGQDEVYVTSFPQPKGRIQISSGGGTSPAWSKDGTEIFYARGDAMIAARVTTSPGVRVLSREELFTGSYLQYRWYRQYDLMPDGEHFLMILNPPRGSIEMVTNWFTELDEILEDGE